MHKVWFLHHQKTKSNKSCEHKSNGFFFEFTIEHLFFKATPHLYYQQGFHQQQLISQQHHHQFNPHVQHQQGTLPPIHQQQQVYSQQQQPLMHPPDHPPPPQLQQPVQQDLSSNLSYRYSMTMHSEQGMN